MMLCVKPGCGRPAEKKGRCRTHYLENERERNNTNPNKRHYHTKRWRLARRAQLHREPLCQDPHGIHGNLPPIAQEVHHIHGVENDPHHRELMSLCRPCHARITREGGSFLTAPNPRDAPWADRARRLEIENDGPAGPLEAA